MARTERQLAADAALEVAIQEVALAYDYVQNKDGMVPALARYFLVMCHRRFTVEDIADGDTEGRVMYNWTCDGAGQPWHELLGMVEIGEVLVRSDMAAGRED